MPRVSSFYGIAIYMYWNEADYRLRLLFNDGTVGDVDFSSRQWSGVLEPLRDPTFFAQVRVDPEAATIAWPNGIDMAPETACRRQTTRSRII